MSQFSMVTSNSSGISQSSRATNLSSEDKDEEILQLKRKLKVLKEEVIRVRDSKGSLENQYLEAKSRLETQESALKDKESAIVRLQGENAQLQDKIVGLKTKLEKENGLKSSTVTGSQGSNNGTSIGIGSSIGEMFGLRKGGPDELKKLQTEYNYLRKQFDTVREKIMKANEEKDIMRKELKKEIESLRGKLAHSDEELGKKIQEAENLEKLYKAITQAHAELKDQLSRQEADFEYLKNRHSILVKERDHYKSTAEEKTKLLEDQSVLLQQLENQTRILAEKKSILERNIVEKENHIADQESRYQAFPVIRKAVLDSPAQLLLRRDVEGDFVIDIETVEERKILLPYQISSVVPNKENPNVFVISYRVKPGKEEQETFESKDAAKLLKSLKKFMENSREKSKAEQTTRKGEFGQKKDKKFFAEVVGFFAS